LCTAEQHERGELNLVLIRTGRMKEIYEGEQKDKGLLSWNMGGCDHTDPGGTKGEVKV